MPNEPKGLSRFGIWLWAHHIIRRFGKKNLRRAHYGKLFVGSICPCTTLQKYCDSCKYRNINTPEHIAMGCERGVKFSRMYMSDMLKIRHKIVKKLYHKR